MQCYKWWTMGVRSVRASTPKRSTKVGKGECSYVDALDGDALNLPSVGVHHKLARSRINA